MTDSPVPTPDASDTPPQWKPLRSIDRRVLGVLIEKAKTTPDAYPLSLNAVSTGCNQKNNRDPLMQLEPEDVEESLDRLREYGVVGLVQGIGRVSKYRHHAYQWLGVDKVELAVMGELLLRGAQTEGELRGRAARMEPIAGLPELRPVLASLKAKGLVIPLTPEGRGHVVTHALYQPPELDKLRAQHGTGNVSVSPCATMHSSSSLDKTSELSSEPNIGPDMLASLRAELAETRKLLPEWAKTESPEKVLAELGHLREILCKIREELDVITTAQQKTDEEVRQLRESLGG
ncbi:MAG TPA: DUF480 domain-containing protein [Thermoguttaceae bacterium]|nr:DUF480 domain-containing protein [Thermoguttaceae bacterium]